MAADGMILQTRFDLPEADDDGMGLEVDPTLADEEQLDEDIVSSKKARTAPDLEYL
jgi:hypothetical protein